MDGVDPTLSPDLIAKIGVLHTINEKVTEYIRAIPELEPVHHIFDEDSATVEQDIQDAMQGTEKLSIMLGTGDGTDVAEGAVGQVIFNPLEIQILCIEQPNLNRGEGGTGITVNRLAELVAINMKGQPIGEHFVSKVDFRIPKNLGGSVAARLVVLTCAASLQLNNSTLSD